MLTAQEKFAPPARRVVFAVAVSDAASGAPLSSGIKVEPLDADGKPMNGPPVINASGKFVWIEPNSRWPARLRVGPDDKGPAKLPFEEAIIDVARPADPIPPDRRLIPVRLRPTAAYPFGEGITAVRGRLLDGPDDDAEAIPGALVQLAWKDAAGEWRPGAPAAGHVALPGEAITDSQGQFAVFVRMSKDNGMAVGNDGLIPVQLQVTRDIEEPDTWVVPAAGWGVGHDVEGIQAGRLFDRDASLAWRAN